MRVKSSTLMILLQHKYKDCLQSSLVYICKANTPDMIENYPHYIGLTENTFKDRFSKHKNSFKFQILYGKKNMPTLKRILYGMY